MKPERANLNIDSKMMVIGRLLLLGKYQFDEMRHKRSGCDIKHSYCQIHYSSRDCSFLPSPIDLVIVNALFKLILVGRILPLLQL